MNTALKLGAFSQTEERNETAELFAVKKAALDTLTAELDLLKAELIEESETPWLEKNAAKPTSSVDLGKAKVTYTQRKKLVPAVPEAAEGLFDPTFELAIDGSAVPAEDRQDLLDALSVMGIPSDAVKVSAGYRARKEALTEALGTGDKALIEFVRENAGYSPSVRVNKPKKVKA